MNRLIFFLLFFLIQTSLSQDFTNPQSSFPLTDTFIHNQETDSTVIKVRIWGEVVKPGVYIIPKASTLLDVIAIAGGPKDTANLKKVSILFSKMPLSNNYDKTINLYSLLITGQNEKIPQIKNNTTIVIEKSSKQKFMNSLTTTTKILNIISVFLIIYYYLR